MWQQTITYPCLGTLFAPEADCLFPGVIILPGSDGGIPEAIAKRIATQGYSVLALGFFGVDPLPRTLENIPLEYFQQAIDYLAPKVKNNSITVMGYSRGGELVLLLSAYFPARVRGVIAFVPCSMVCGGFPYINQPAWTFNNQPITPFLHGLMSHDETWTEADDLRLACEQGIIPYHNNSIQDPYEVAALFSARHEHQKADLAAAVIPVECIQCPLLIIAGNQDKIWPSALYAEQIMDRLDRKNSPIVRKSCVYPEAGHGILAPYEKPVYHKRGKFWCTLGGTPEGNRLASEQAWNELFQFLQATCNV